MTRQELDALNALSRSQLAIVKALASLTFFVRESLPAENAEAVMGALTHAIDSMDDTIKAVRSALEENTKDGSTHG